MQLGPHTTWRRCLRIGLALAAGGWALGLPPEPEAQLGTFREGPVLTAGHVHRHHADFAGAILDWRADLKDADLSGCSFAGADLAGVDLTGALLLDANLEGADCRDAILRNADLTGANLSGVNLVRADLTGARLPEGALDDPRVVLRDTLGPEGNLLAPSQPAASTRAPGVDSPVSAAPASGGASPAIAVPVSGGASPAIAANPAEAALRLPPWRPTTGGEARDAALGNPWLPADLQPFFRRRGPVGSSHFLALPANERDISKLVAVPKGVAWLHEGAQTIQLLRPDGLRTAWGAALGGDGRLDRGDAVLDLGEGHGRIWWTTAGGSLYITPTKQLTHPSGKLLESTRFPFPAFMAPRPGSLTLTRDHIWALGPRASNQDELVLYGILLDRVLKADLRKVKSENVRDFQSNVDLGRLLRVQAGPTDELLSTTERGLAVADAAACHAKGKGTHFGIGMGVTPERELLTRAGALCFTYPLGDVLIHYRRDTQEQIIRGPFLKPRLRVGDVAEGPSGRIWFTEPRNQAICQLDPVSGTIQRYPLSGLSPGLIVNGHNGLMYFSIDGGRFLGEIVADADGLDRPPPKPAAAAAAASAASGPARPTTKERAQQRKRERKAASKAAAAAAGSGASAASAASAAMPKASPPSPADSSEEDGCESDASEDAPASPRLSAAAAVPGPALEAAPEVLLQHILEEHRFGAPNDKGQFLEGMAPERIRALALESLARREIPLIRNLEGRWETQHSFPGPVGFYLDWRTGAWRTTPRLRVVLNADQTTILTAFPVRP